MVLSPWTCVCGQHNAGPSPCSRCLTAAPVSVVAEPIIDAPPSRPRWLAPLAVVVAFLLLSGAVAVGLVDGASSEPSAEDLPGAQTISVTPEGGPTGLTGTAGEIAAALPGLMRFVEEARGLEFVKPVEVTLLPDDSFRARLAALIEEDADGDRAEERAEDARVLVALGLLEPGVDLAKADESLLGDAVAGYYDSEDDDLVVRGSSFSPYVKVTFVHELTHALQDQHFDIDQDGLDERDDEASTAFTVLVEGDAARVERLYMDSLSDAELKAAEAEEIEAASGIDPSIPRILLEFISIPYVIGPQFVDKVFEAGGQARLDDLYRNPPTTTEQVLHPERFLEDGEEPRAVDDPEAEGDEIDGGVFGELVFILMFQRFMEGQTALAAATGWGGDRYVAWRDGDGACVRVNLVMDSGDDAREMSAALRTMAGERDGVDVTVTRSLITFTACA